VCVCVCVYVHSGRRHGQIYSYPAQRWKKKSSLPLPDIPLPHAKSADVELPESGVFVFLEIECVAYKIDICNKVHCQHLSCYC